MGAGLHPPLWLQERRLSAAGSPAPSPSPLRSSSCFNSLSVCFIEFSSTLDSDYFFLLSSVWVLCFVTTGNAVLITDSGSLWILASGAVPADRFSPPTGLFSRCVRLAALAPDLRVAGVLVFLPWDCHREHSGPFA